jgi:hypothetical protein
MIKTNAFFDLTDFQVCAGLVEAHGMGGEWDVLLGTSL